MSRANAQKEVAIFDIDGTVQPGYNIFHLADELAKKGLFDQGALDKMVQQMKAYKAGSIDYNTFADLWVATYAEGIAGQDVRVVDAFSTKLWQTRRDTVYTFVHPLMNELRRAGSRTIAISGSPEESLKPLLELLRFDEWYTTQVARSNGQYTSRVQVNAASLAQKEGIVARVFDTIPPKTITHGYGDSVADLAFLKRVTHPTVVGTRDEELHAIAKQNGWPIIIPTGR